MLVDVLEVTAQLPAGGGRCVVVNVVDVVGVVSSFFVGGLGLSGASKSHVQYA